MLLGRVKSLDAIWRPPRRRLHRSLGAFQLTLLGIGASSAPASSCSPSAAAQKAGPGMMLSFVIAGVVCAVAALCYAELASMVPVAGLGLHLYLCRDGRVARLDGRLGARSSNMRSAQRRSRSAGRAISSGCMQELGRSLSRQRLPARPVARAAVINLPAFVIALLVTGPADHRHQGKRARQRRARG